MLNEDDIGARAERRTPSYADPMDLAKQFSKYLRGWQPEAYEQMARATLRHDEASGKWLLACPREYEAHIFRSNRESKTWTRMANMPVAVKLICADPAAGEQMPTALIEKPSPKRPTSSMTSFPAPPTSFKSNGRLNVFARPRSFSSTTDFRLKNPPRKNYD